MGQGNCLVTHGHRQRRNPLLYEIRQIILSRLFCYAFYVTVLKWDQTRLPWDSQGGGGEDSDYFDTVLGLS